MNKQKTFRYVLVTAAAAVVAMPLIAQVRSARSAAQQQPPAPSLQALPPATQFAQVDPNKVIASQGQYTVTAGEFDAVATTIPPQYVPALAQPNVRKRLIDSILQVKLLAVEAKRRGVDQNAQVKRQVEMKQDELLAEALQKQLQAGAPRDGDREYFEAHKSSFDQIKARHILIRTPDSPAPLPAGKTELTDAQAQAKAQKIKEQLDKGGDFAAIAKAESDDVRSGAMGGDLGILPAWQLDATFSRTAQSLQPNQISNPVKTAFGYHIIQLLENKSRTYDQAKGEIGQAQVASLLGDFKRQAPTYDQAFIGSTPGAAAPAASGAIPSAPPQVGKGS